MTEKTFARAYKEFILRNILGLGPQDYRFAIIVSLSCWKHARSAENA
jgi:hypothetical protein